MKFLFSTGSLYTYSIERCFDLAARSGFDGIELMVDQRWDTRQPDFLHRLSDRHELPILAVHAPFTDVPGWPSGQPALISESVQLAEALGASVVIHHLPVRIGYVLLLRGGKRTFIPTPGINGEGEYRRWLEGDYAALQAQTEVSLCIENMPARHFLGRRFNGHTWNTPDELMHFPTLTMDTTHLGTWGLEPSDIYDHWGKQVGHIHLSNYDGREHQLPQRGRLKLNELLAKLSAAAYGGAVTLELHPAALDAGRPDEHIAAMLRTSLDICRRWTGSTASDEPGVR